MEHCSGYHPFQCDEYELDCSHLKSLFLSNLYLLGRTGEIFLRVLQRITSCAPFKSWEELGGKGVVGFKMRMSHYYSLKTPQIKEILYQL